MIEIVKDCDLMYRLLQDPESEDLALEVVCGNVGMYTMVVNLSQDEVELYVRDGKDALDNLARAIFTSPNEYTSR